MLPIRSVNQKSYALDTLGSPFVWYVLWFGLFNFFYLVLKYIVVVVGRVEMWMEVTMNSQMTPGQRLGVNLIRRTTWKSLPGESG